MFFGDAEIEGRVVIVSGCRTLAKQKYLFNGWVKRLPGFNLAADPNRVFGGGKWRGSWHMQQADGYCYAVDLRRKRNIFGKSKISWADVERVAKEYGLRRTVPSENWHYQHRNAAGVFPAPEMALGRPWPRRPSSSPVLKRRLVGLSRMNSLPHVRWLQREILFVKPDGVFGPVTEKKVRDLQSYFGLEPDGVVGMKTWGLLDRLGAPRA